MSSDAKLPARSSRREVADFLAKVKAMPVVGPAGSVGRLIFAMDATASRGPTWDHACKIQGEMFVATRELGGLQIQLAWYRGFAEFEASPWVTNSADLVRRMTTVTCAAGETQIGRVLRHALAVTRARKIQALVFVGDAVEEGADKLTGLAGELGMLGVPVFVFHEGGETIAARTLKEIARLSGGAYCPFDAGSAEALRDLLAAVATFAAGGRKALADFSRKRGGATLLLANQMR
jgi:hypothetical protein